MTLKKLRAARRAAVSFSPERRQIRSLLRKATRGNAHAYVQVASNYTNLISEYLYLCGVTDSAHRHFEIKRILSDCWRYLPYTRRVSDFERFLQVRLERQGSDCSVRFAHPHEALATLDHEQRFLLAARIFEGWSMKALKLALRSNKHELLRDLMKLKCRVSGISLEKMSDAERVQVFRVNELLEGGCTDKQCRKIEKELSGQYHAHQFKADWLEYRCELADLRMEMAISQEDATELSESTTQLIKEQPMEKPRLYDNLINQISFVRLPLL